ncbi:hypothetical protein [Novosphingobium rosa]|uniref:hypothetical protein n=1 Tax=Novosphingobium rosa TaxID=76978 RepID=UPI0008363448|nr:hypothetical protein [Novosphingobium rosa]
MDHGIEGVVGAVSPRPKPHKLYYFWRRPLAKVLWGAFALFWAGFLVAQMVDWLGSIYETMPANYLKILLQPVLILILLTPRYVRAWIESEDWVEDEDYDPNAWPNGPLVGPGSPYSDPTNPRSGGLYLRHFGYWKD